MDATDTKLPKVNIKLPKVTYVVRGLVFKINSLWPAVQRHMVENWDELLRKCMRHCVRVTGYNSVGAMVLPPENIIVYCNTCRQKLQRRHLNYPAPLFCTGEFAPQEEAFYKEVCRFLDMPYFRRLQTVYVTVRENMDLDEMLYRMN